jgi:hypothetical protein
LAILYAASVRFCEAHLRIGASQKRRYNALRLKAISKLRSLEPLACRLGSFSSEGASGTLALPCSKQVLK